MNKQELIEHIGNTLDKYLKNTTFVKPVLSITEIAKSDEVSLEFEIGKSCILLDDVSYQFGYDKGKLDGEWVGQQLKDADKIRQELNKPVVPQFVADWIEKAKKWKLTLYYALDHSPEKVILWLNENEANRQITFARAWLDGYEVEKEKRYLVKMKSIDTNFNFLNRHRNENYWIFSSKDKNTLYQTQHTQKELEAAGFGEVFNSKLFEAKEVKDES